MRLISIIGLFCMIFFAVGFDFSIFLDIPSILLVVFGTIFLTGVTYKKGNDRIGVIQMIRKNSIIIGFIISFLSIFLFLIQKTSYENSYRSVYIAISILPFFYGGIISLIADILLRDKNNNTIHVDVNEYVNIENEEIIQKKELNLNESESEEIYNSLTDREKDILILIKTGMSNKEIGIKSYISENTVKKHVGNIFAKLGVKNRVELLNKLNQR